MTRWSCSAATQKEMKFRLEKSGSLPPGMVRVPGDETTFVALSGISHIEQLPVGDYLIDRYEVTNGQFQEFVDQGGYASRQFWKHLPTRIRPSPGKTPWSIRRLDREARPGRLENGRYPEGHRDYPVRGVSWFEAAAYAEFAGKRLPSVYHWARAADLWGAADIVPLATSPTSTWPRPDATVGRTVWHAGHGR